MMANDREGFDESDPFGSSALTIELNSPDVQVYDSVNAPEPDEKQKREHALIIDKYDLHDE